MTCRSIRNIRARAKIDIHEMEDDLLERAAHGGSPIETTIIGTAEDGTPTCATARPIGRRIATR